MISNDGISEFGLPKCEHDRLMLSGLSHHNRFITMMQGANRANVFFYPVDPDRLFSGTHTLTSNQALEMMVSITDGLLISETALFESGLRRIVDDLSNYYLLGYYSTADADGKFHKITVRVKRPGVQVRARAGYLAAKAGEAVEPMTSVAPRDTSDTKLMVARVIARELLTRAAAARACLGGVDARSRGRRASRGGVVAEHGERRRLGKRRAARGDLDEQRRQAGSEGKRDFGSWDVRGGNGHRADFAA